MANHCKDDREYDGESKEVFEKDLDETEDFLKACYKKAGKKKNGSWFRAPSGKMSKVMEEALLERGMTNVMMDCYGKSETVKDDENEISPTYPPPTPRSLQLQSPNRRRSPHPRPALRRLLHFEGGHGWQHHHPTLS